jgi:hypothetical protein
MMVGRDSVIGIVIRYRLGGLGIESRWGEIFHTRPDVPGAHQNSHTIGTGSFPGGKRSGRCVNHPPPSNTKAKERVEMCLYRTKYDENRQVAIHSVVPMYALCS